MKRIANFPAMVGSIINGDFLLTSIVPRMTQFGAPFKEPMLEDATGHLTVYAWDKSGLLERILATTPTRIRAKLRVRELQGTTIANLLGSRQLEDHEVTNAAALLPRQRAPRWHTWRSHSSLPIWTA